MDDKQTRLMTVLAVVLVALVLVIRFVEPPDETDEVDGPELTDLVELELEDVTALTLTSAEGTVSGERTMSGWVVTSPWDARGNDEAFDELVETLARMQVEEPLVDADPSKYGFDDPQAQLRVTTAAGELRFVLGMESPVGFKSYVRVDEGPVQVAAGRPARSLVRPPELFRDRRVHPVAAPLIDGLRLTSEDGPSWTVERRAEGWFLDDGRRASDARVQGLLAAVDALEYDVLYPERAEDPFPTELALQDAAGEAVLAFGGLAGGGLLLRGPDGSVGTIGAWDELQPSADELVETRLLAASPAWLSELVIELDGASGTWTKTEEGWTRDGQPVDGVLPSVLTMELEADRTQTGVLGAPTGLVRASGNGQVVEVTLGAPTEDGRWGSEDGPAFLVPQASVDRLASMVGAQ